MRVLHVIPGSAGGSSYIFAKRQVDALERAGVVAERFFFDTSFSLPGFLRQVRRCRRVIREFRPDLVHAHYGTVTALFCAVVSRVPLVLTFAGSDLLRDYDIGRVREAVGHLLSQVASLRASGIVCASRGLRDRLWFRPARERVEIVTWAVNLDVFRRIPRDDARRELGWGPGEKVVFFNIGRAPRRKRLDLAEAAVQTARRLCGDIRFVTMNNDLPPAKVPVMMNAADCLLVTSEAEGSPNVVREAMACDLPVVSVEVGDVREWLGGVQPSCIVARDPGELGKALAGILEASRRSNGRAVVERGPGEPQMVERMAAIYAKALERGAGKARRCAE